MTYQEASAKSNIPINNLRLMVHKKRKIGNINDKRGRAKLLDSPSEEKIMTECKNIATDSTQISSIGFKKLIKAAIKKEFLATYKRRYNQTTVENYTTPSSRTVGRYVNEFSKKLLETF